MTVEEQLADLELLRTALSTAIRENALSGTILSNTSNGTKIVYEGASVAYNTLKKIDGEISQIKISLTHNLKLGQ
jgi:hypothetical protein